MANDKITQLTETTSIASDGTDVMEISINVATTPASRKIKLLNLLKSIFTSSGTQLSIGALTDLQVLARNGTTVASGAAVTTSGLTQATGKMLGRSTATTGAIEEITVGSGLTLSAGSLTATGTGGTVTTTGTPSSGQITKFSGATTITNATAATDYVGPGSVTTSGLTQNTGKMLGRTTASSGAIEEITIGTALSLSSTTLNATVPAIIQAACSDETTALTTGTAKVTFRMPRAMTVTDVRASLTTAQASGSIFTVDINEAGTSILSTKLTIDNTELTSTTAATPPVISDANLADDAQITVDIDQIGASGATGLKIALIGTWV